MMMQANSKMTLRQTAQAIGGYSKWVPSVKELKDLLRPLKEFNMTGNQKGVSSIEWD